MARSFVSLRNAAWVAEYITPDSLKKADDVNRVKASFKADMSTPDLFRVSPADYLNSGYDRGHLAPARDMSSSQESVNASFLMTNISPQVGKGFNRGYWSRFEGFVRHLATHYGGVYVVTGPLFLPARTPQGNSYEVQYPVVGSPPTAIAVPTHFFKVVLVQKPSTHSNAYLAAGFVLPNQAIPDHTNLTTFVRPIEYIEGVSGLLFFDQLRYADTSRRVSIGQLCNDLSCALPAAVEYKTAIASKNSSNKEASK
ncbi:hypothetical protein B5M09_004086 [Aphanomyces astaci]|uniref:Endonuclease n=2 Tax=Aphanomyces astaci TaxID=112090 RepID=A0A425D2U8_APHAT|nr:hypothetical protein B5M09_004086 [Aphanomyces astaci]